MGAAASPAPVDGVDASGVPSADGTSADGTGEAPVVGALAALVDDAEEEAVSFDAAGSRLQARSKNRQVKAARVVRMARTYHLFGTQSAWSNEEMGVSVWPCGALKPPLGRPTVL